IDALVAAQSLLQSGRTQLSSAVHDPVQDRRLSRRTHQSAADNLHSDHPVPAADRHHLLLLLAYWLLSVASRNGGLAVRAKTPLSAATKEAARSDAGDGSRHVCCVLAPSQHL